jgi:uncharacterized membrane protein
MFKFISKNILTGLFAMLPVVLTLYLLYWFVVTAETAMGSLIQLVLPDQDYWPGMGMIAGLLLAFLVGLLMHAYVVRLLFEKGEQLLFHMPLIKSVYRAIRDFFNYFSPTTKKEFEQVVSVTIAGTGMQVIGLITQAIPENIPAGMRKDDDILVYLPMSYMIGGYAVLMPRSAVKPLNMNIEEAMRFILTAGVTAIPPK